MSPIRGWRYLGLQEVEVEKIAGSVDRYDDFDRAFLPYAERTSGRSASRRL